MSDDVNLSAYFERIGFVGSIAPNLQTLQALHAAHPAAIPFENLNSLLERPVPLDLKSLEQKLVRDQRGGYCFEHNMLFWHVLRTLGYEVKGLAARVLWERPIDAVTRLSHMVLLVDIGGSTYIADVGYGGMTMTAPLRLRPGVEQETPHEPYRISGEDPAFVVEAKLGEDWRPLMRFDLSDYIEADYETFNWFAATHPTSIHRRELIAARAGKGRRLSLHNARFTTRTMEGEAEVRRLQSVAELRETLEGPFGIVLPQSERLDPLLERILALPEQG